MEKLRNKVALIRGGTSGVGLATAKDFIHEGTTVIITGRNRKTVDEIVKQLGTSAFGFVSDAAKLSDIFGMQAQIKKHAILQSHPLAVACLYPLRHTPAHSYSSRSDQQDHSSAAMACSQQAHRVL